MPGVSVLVNEDYAATGELASLSVAAQAFGDSMDSVAKMLAEAGSGHPGGSLGMADVYAVLWFGGFLHTDPAQPQWPERDRFVLSNGHICPILYAILARKGYFPREDLWTLRKLGSPLQGHPDFHFTRGVDCCTGSLGNGVSVGLGMALAARVTGRGYRVYVGSSDGECQEGQVWEMATAAAHHKAEGLARGENHDR